MKITEEGKRKLEAELEAMNAELQKIIDEKTKAYELTGDTWHDNPYFNQQEQREREMLAKIKKLRAELKEAEIVSATRNMTQADIGSIMRCHCKYPGFDGEKVIEIVGHGEGNPAEGKIDYKTPVGQNLMGHKKGDKISFRIPRGTAVYEILEFYSSREAAK